MSKNDAELRSQIESLQAELKETKEAAENSGETTQGLWNNGFIWILTLLVYFRNLVFGWW